MTSDPVMSSLSTYTCITCRVSFAEPDIQRAHYKTDWHRYNLKRKVAELPPVTAENFQDRVLSQQAPAKEEAKHQVCQACKKHFSSENAYTSHLRSRKHKENATRIHSKENDLKEDDIEKIADKLNAVNSSDHFETVDAEKIDEEDSDDEPEPLEITECLFCPNTSKDLESSLKHMSVKHGFFVPDLHFLVNIKGLIEYLCEKVGLGLMCLWCNTKGKAFHSVESVQQHMVDKCHCRIFFEGDSALEYAEYFDYTPSYPEQKEGETSATCDTIVPDNSLKISDDLELVLPSGAKVGHRSLKHTFKQHLPTFEQRKATLVGRLMTQYRALGWKEDGGEGVLKKQRDVKWALKMKQASDMRLKVKANKMQPHLRPQVVF